MPIEPIKIPQNVYIEDRIVGPLTLKQLIISAIGCGLSYALFTSMSKAMGGTPPLPISVLIWIPGVLSILFAFIRINDLSMLHILLLLVERANKPTTRVWAPRKGITITFRSAPAQKQKKAAAAPVQSASRIDELSSILDRPSAELIAAHTGTDDREAEPQDAEEQIPLAEAAHRLQHPVDPSRIGVSPLQQANALMDIAPRTRGEAPQTGTVSVMKDLSPRTS